MHRSRSARLATLAFLAFTGQAAAQSFNIEVGTSAAVPSSSFGAAAGVAGTWNPVTSSTAATIALKNLDGTNSSVNMTHSTTGSFFNNTNANITGDYQSLLNDVQADGTITYSFTGLQTGQYNIYTYALDAHSSINACHVSVNNAQGITSQDSGFNTPTGNEFHIGGTHALHSRIVNLGDTVTITITPVGGGISQLAGIQIVRMGNNGVLPRFYVNDNAPGDGGGRSWSNAMNDLQDAIECTRRIGSGNEVWVASGTYKPTSGTDQNISFVPRSGMQLYGGFNATETSLSQRANPLLNQTILSGAINTASDTDNSECVVDASGTSGSTIIDGFSIIRGYGNGAVARGGGMRLDGSFALIRTCRFLYNTAGEGGGVGMSGGSGPKLVDCYFYQNYAFGNGGGFYTENNLNTVRIVNCDFIGNTCSSEGAGIATSSAAVACTNCLFTGNQSSGFEGGAAYIKGNAATPLSTSFTNCSFSNNRAPIAGGAVYATTRGLVALNSCILWGDICSADASLNEVGVHPADNSAITYVQSTVAGKAGTDGLNPMYVDANGTDNIVGNTDDNLRLQLGSPCIDTGSAVSLPADDFDLDQDSNTAEKIPYDLDSKSRKSDVLGSANGGAAGSPALDRGCYEVQMPDCPADINNDGMVDLNDFFAFFNAWDIEAPAADIDLSGEIDLTDYFAFFNAFDTSCL